ncbi:hypothetical protein C9J03_04920 [Photobacterium gaetbulicola]|nr:hypothetical protein C9J03_04920 [Photobacterium gaetbulicola]
MNQEAWFYTIAEERLSQFAERVGDDLPEGYEIVNKIERDNFEGVCNVNLKLVCNIKNGFKSIS